MSRPIDNPLLQDLGITIVEWRPGFCAMELEAGARHLNRRGRLQGGVAATLLDAVCGYAGLLQPGREQPDEAATVTLTVNFIGALRQERLRAVGELRGGGRHIYFSAGELYAQDGSLAATAQGSFRRADRE
jgi:uncharacterized protein (TIGR00369 family)